MKFFPLLAFILIFPLFLSRKSRVVRRIVIRRRPAEIFPFLNDLRNWSLWTVWSRRDEIDFSYDGPPAGIGATQKWSTPKMEGILKIVQSLPDERIAYDLAIDGGKHEMQGVLLLEDFDGVTRVTWVSNWVGCSNPYARYFDLLCRWWVGRDFDAGLANLKQLAERE